MASTPDSIGKKEGMNRSELPIPGTHPFVGYVRSLFATKARARC